MELIQDGVTAVGDSLGLVNECCNQYLSLTSDRIKHFEVIVLVRSLREDYFYDRSSCHGEEKCWSASGIPELEGRLISVRRKLAN